MFLSTFFVWIYVDMLGKSSLTTAVIKNNGVCETLQALVLRKEDWSKVWNSEAGLKFLAPSQIVEWHKQVVWQYQDLHKVVSHLEQVIRKCIKQLRWEPEIFQILTDYTWLLPYTLVSKKHVEKKIFCKAKGNRGS